MARSVVVVGLVCGVAELALAVIDVLHAPFLIVVAGGILPQVVVDHLAEPDGTLP